MSEVSDLQHKGRKGRRDGDRWLRTAPHPPPGLTELQLDGPDVEELLDRSLAEVEAILHDELLGQLSQNQHFFINLPFPLKALTRERDTPLFSFGNTRVSALSDLINSALDQLGFSSGEKADMLPRANAIVREYHPGQQISFHVDEDTCDAQVVGVILLNDSRNNSYNDIRPGGHQKEKKKNGLHFRKGEGKYTLEYVVDEHRGTAFIMEQEARYCWQHGLPRAPARRISVTVRFFKHRALQESAFLIERHRTQQFSSVQSFADEPLPCATENLGGSLPSEVDARQQEVRVTVSQNSDKHQCKPAILPQPTSIEDLAKLSKNKLRVTGIRVTLIKNSEASQRKPAILPQPTSIEELAKLSKNKLRVTGIRFFDGQGDEVHNGRVLEEDSEVYVCCKHSENFSRTCQVQSCMPEQKVVQRQLSGSSREKRA